MVESDFSIDILLYSYFIHYPVLFIIFPLKCYYSNSFFTVISIEVVSTFSGVKYNEHKITLA